MSDISVHKEKKRIRQIQWRGSQHQHVLCQRFGFYTKNDQITNTGGRWWYGWKVLRILDPNLTPKGYSCIWLDKAVQHINSNINISTIFVCNIYIKRNNMQISLFLYSGNARYQRYVYYLEIRKIMVSIL